MSAMRRPTQLGQSRPLQLKATRRSKPHCGQRTRAKPCAGPATVEVTPELALDEGRIAVAVASLFQEAFRRAVLREFVRQEGGAERRSAIAAVSDRQGADPVPAFLDYDDRALFQSVRAVGKNRRQALDDVRGARVVETKDDDACRLSAGKRRDLSKVEIDREHHPSLGDRFVEDVPVRESLKSFVSQVDRVVPLFTQPRTNADVEAHVHKEPHAPSRP